VALFAGGKLFWKWIREPQSLQPGSDKCSFYRTLSEGLAVLIKGSSGICGKLPNGKLRAQLKFQKVNDADLKINCIRRVFRYPRGWDEFRCIEPKLPAKRREKIRIMIGLHSQIGVKFSWYHK
jgi:hypothetical protein